MSQMRGFLARAGAASESYDLCVGARFAKLAVVEQPASKFKPALIYHTLQVFRVRMKIGAQLRQPGDFFRGEIAAQCGGAAIGVVHIFVWHHGRTSSHVGLSVCVTLLHGACQSPYNTVTLAHQMFAYLDG